MNCEYGCNQEAKFQLKNGKWCCENSYNKCIEIKRKNKEANKNGQLAKPFDNIENLKCEFGCNEIAKYIFKNGKRCCKERDNYCKGRSIKISIANKGKKRSDEFKIKTSEFRKNKPSGMLGKKQTEFCKLFNSERLKNGEAKRLNLIPRNPEKLKIKNEKSRERMKNGGAKHMHSFPCMGYKTHTEWMKKTNGKHLRKSIQKISKDEIRLRNIIQELYSNCEFQYPVLNYDLDIALPEYKIAIEFDGYYHFDTEEHIKYHKFRQEQIEKEGWKFYRVTMFDKFPTSEEVKKNIEKAKNERRSKKES